MTIDKVTLRVTNFIRENLKPEGMTEEITETTGLLETGVLDSLGTAMLLNFIREDLGVTVPPLMLDFKNFRNIQSVAAMVCGLLLADAGR